MSPPPVEIRAAGVVCLREVPASGPTSDGATEVLLVYRTRRRDWSLPKGKLDRGEHAAAAAVRETREETGYHVVLGPPLPTQRYTVAGRVKSVDYWLAHVVGRGAWEPDDEVAEVRWVPVSAAAALLTYPHDAVLLGQALGTLRGTTPLVLLRHAQAEKRGDFAARHDGHPPADPLRQLTRVGESQSEDLVPMLGAYGITRVHSSDAVRCRDTLRPYAENGGFEVQLEPGLSEEGFEDDPAGALARWAELMHTPLPLVVCTHRPVLAAIVGHLRKATGMRSIDHELPPGGCYVMHRDLRSDGLVIVAAERHQP